MSHKVIELHTFLEGKRVRDPPGKTSHVVDEANFLQNLKILIWIFSSDIFQKSIWIDLTS